MGRRSREENVVKKMEGTRRRSQRMGIMAGIEKIDNVTGRLKIRRRRGSSNEELRLGMDMLSGNEASTGKESVSGQGSKRKDKVVRNDMKYTKCEEAEVQPKEEGRFSREGIKVSRKKVKLSGVRGGGKCSDNCTRAFELVAGLTKRKFFEQRLFISNRLSCAGRCWWPNVINLKRRMRRLGQRLRCIGVDVVDGFSSEDSDELFSDDEWTAYDGVYEDGMDWEVDVGSECEEELTESTEEKITKFGPGGVHHSDGRVFTPISVILDSGTEDAEGGDGSEDMDNGNNLEILQAFEKSGGRHVVSFMLNDEAPVEVLKGCMYVFDDGLAMNEWLVGVGKLELRWYDLLCIGPGGLVNGMVIGAYAQLLSLDAKERGAYDTWFFPTMISEYELPKNLDVCRNAEKIALLDNYTGHPDLCDKIVAPLHDKEREHWFCIVIKMRKGVVEIWDSALHRDSRKASKPVVSKMLYTLDVLLSEMFLRRLGGSFTFRDFSIEHALDFPQQVGCKDCGVFVLQMMRSVSTRQECCKEFSVDEARVGLLTELLTSKYNGRKKNLMGGISRYFEQCLVAYNGGVLLLPKRAHVSLERGTMQSCRVKNPARCPIGIASTPWKRRRKGRWGGRKR